MKSSNRPFAIILRTSVQQPTQHEPTVAYFSSRGPGSAPGIIKPDLAAPGRNILAAWPPFEKARADSIFYDIMSGTSMATPHVTGVAALLKALYPHWSPAEIKSALMTTAYNLDNAKNPIQTDSGNVIATPYDIGSGLLNPNAALNPGLVYDFNMEDIVSYLCSSAVGQLESLKEHYKVYWDIKLSALIIITLHIMILTTPRSKFQI
ncbi:subtilisin-like serine-protease S [Nicotiana sylvestris]|uniref:Subtilisin-like protease n=1 Tax=Nicotiana sylvestris TaxID=4096 RepID=A0A1U7YCP2_NICSY|nr:PREDICTED: subtilisin-like protease [Nicotiana sylvestris]